MSKCSNVIYCQRIVFAIYCEMCFWNIKGLYTLTATYDGYINISQVNARTICILSHTLHTYRLPSQSLWYKNNMTFVDTINNPIFYGYTFCVHKTITCFRHALVKWRLNQSSNIRKVLNEKSWQVLVSKELARKCNEGYDVRSRKNRVQTSCK